MTDVRRYEVKLEELRDYFSSLTKDQLARYNVDCHSGGIERLVFRYLNPLLEATTKGRYPFAGDNISFVSSTHEGEWGEYHHDNGSIERISYKTLPEEVGRYLSDETGLLLAVLDSFKKINWKLQEKLGPMTYEKAPPLRKNLGDYIQELHQAMTSISELHHSERNRAFVVTSPEGNPDLDTSNRIRNQLYQFIDRVLEKEKDPIIDLFLEKKE